MALYFIEAVSFDETGQNVIKLRCGRSKGGQVMPPATVTEPRELNLSQILNELLPGDELISKFNQNGSITLGAKIHIERDAEGDFIVHETEREISGLGLSDLPRF